MSFNVSLNKTGVAIIDHSQGEVDPFDALKKLNDAVKVQFNVQADMKTIASDFKVLAQRRIGVWTRFKEAIASLLLSCFGYVSTLKKIDTLYEAIIVKHKGAKWEAPKPSIIPGLIDAQVILKDNPHIVECLKKADLEGLEQIIREAKEKRHFPDCFIEEIEQEALIIRIKKLFRDEAFIEANNLIKTIQFDDFKKLLNEELEEKKQKYLEKIKPELLFQYENEGPEGVEKSIHALDEVKQDLAYAALSNVNNWQDATYFAAKIKDEALRKDMINNCGLANDEACEKALSANKFADVLKDVQKNDFIKAIKWFRYSVYSNSSLIRFIAMKGAAFYASRQDFVKLNLMLTHIRFVDLVQSYRALIDNLSDQDKKRLSFLSKVEKARSIDEAIDFIEKESDEGLRYNGYEYVFKNESKFSTLHYFVNAIKDAPLKESFKVKFGLHDKEEITTLPHYHELEQLIESDLKSAHDFVKSLNSPSLFLYFIQKSIEQHLRKEEFSEAKRLLSLFPYSDLRREAEEKIQRQIENLKSLVETFEKWIQQQIDNANLKQCFDELERELRPSHREAGFRLLALQTCDFEAARRALNSIHNAEIKQKVTKDTALLYLDEIHNEEAKKLKTLIDQSRFSEAKKFVCNVDSEFANSFKRCLNEAEIRFYISSKRYDEATNLIKTLPYETLKTKFLYQICFAMAKNRYPNMAKAVELSGNNPVDWDLYDRVDDKFKNQDVDSAFLGLEGKAIEQLILYVHHAFLRCGHFNEALSISLLLNDYIPHLRQIINILFEKREEDAIKYLQLLPIDTQIDLLQRAIEKSYYVDRSFAEKAIKACPARLDVIFYSMIKNSKDKNEAISLLKRIKGNGYLDYAKDSIAQNFADLKFFIESNNIYTWRSHLEAFKKKFKPEAIDSADFLRLEAIVDVKAKLDRDIAKEVYSFLFASAGCEEDKKRITEKINSLEFSSKP